MTTIDETASLAGLVSRDGEALNQRLRELITAQRRVLARAETGAVAPAVEHPREAAGISAQQMRVLALMPTADDRVIARRLDVSVTTVRRQIKVIYGVLGVNNRFAAGVAAAKRGWI